MLHASTQKLILKLCDITERAEAPWREGDGGACWFETEGYRIEVRSEPPTVRVLQSGGREVESADAAQLASAPFPSEPGTTYADRVRRMGLEARRIARGAEAAISTILSALSNPPATDPEPTHFSSEGGPESEAAMAAAVADMAERLKQQPLEQQAPPQLAAAMLAPDTPAPNAPAPDTPAIAPPVEMVRPTSAAASASPLAPAPNPARNARTDAMFGAIASFATASAQTIAPVAALRSPAPSPEPAKSETEAAPAQPKITSSGLVVMGLRAVTVQTPEAVAYPDRMPPSAAGYRPWN